MLLNFTKMNGAGNDFIMLDNRDGLLRLNPQMIAHLCDRHRGIGADGLLVVEKPSSHHVTARMRYYNADGHEAEMCGNGGSLLYPLCGSSFEKKQLLRFSLRQQLESSGENF